ncbi:MAG TPA: rhodanese-like domain-containing protein [Phycisphaerae bacterium]|nr:rhodanese-like domain-containing protein [Phycisphaerae bacterium]HRY66819.1 rhodanese-like domain-containing protein [Phycisphaerae bacterium]HSA26877.1 rhodanese-like domain-containing protein [Phycisphaerae bacterium]
MRKRRGWLLAAILFAVGTARAESGKIKDTESASHGGDAAVYEIVDTYQYPGFRIVQFNLPVLSHYSYILVSGKDALIVDPGRDAQVYLDYARKEGLAVKGVFLTHTHADFVAGHIEVAKATGCPIYKSGVGGADFKYEALKEGDTLAIGEATLKTVETPGHTPESLSGFVYSKQKPDRPEAIFTGDCLFVGSIGRPDLLEGKMTAASLASMSFDTWNNKLSKTGDEAMVFPAHGAGSLCGAHLSDKPFSTIGAEKASNPYLQHRGRSEFIAAVLDGLPEAPQYFKHNAAMNRKGPEPVDWNALSPTEVPASADLTDPAKAYVVDVREATDYAEGHIPNSVNIGVRGRLETWVGIMVPWGAPLVLCGSPGELTESIRRLHRVGYQGKVITLESWKKASLPVAKNAMIKPAELHAMIQRGEGPVVVDVRLPNEWMGLRIGTVVNLPLPHLSELSAKLDPAQPVLAVCNSAYRSSMAVGIFERRGFKKAMSLEGGAEAWMAAGLPVFGAERKAGSQVTAAAPTRSIRLADRVSADELMRLIRDLPGTFDLVDIRPAEHYADYNIPGSRNVDVADVLANPAYLTGAGPLIIVDRDGSLAMQVAGILSQKTERNIRALYGGVEAYWRGTELKPAVREVPLPPTVGPAPSVPAAPPAAPGAPIQPPPPQAPRKKSAGC